MSQVMMETLVQELQSMRLEKMEMKKKLESKEEEVLMEEGGEDIEEEEDWNKPGHDGLVMWDHVLRPTAISPSSPVSINLCNLLGAPPPLDRLRASEGSIPYYKNIPQTQAARKNKVN